MKEENKEENIIIEYIKKQHLIHNKWYEGDCRNSSYAIWNADKEKFEYVRYKFGTSENHFNKHENPQYAFEAVTTYNLVKLTPDLVEYNGKKYSKKEFEQALSKLNEY